ncbi:hypothetical protein WDU94_000353 [Cyamophila willieti]
MSTYLVAFILSDFKCKETKGPVPFRTWTHKDLLKNVDLAAEESPKFLSFFEEYFNIKFPLPKLDMIAIPDFEAGAMENWGLITYRENYMLNDKIKSTVFEEFIVVDTVAHELSHQWFGNLVTMIWWSELWLNEGFATYMSSVALTNVSKTLFNQLLLKLFFYVNRY